MVWQQCFDLLSVSGSDCMASSFNGLSFISISILYNYTFSLASFPLLAYAFNISPAIFTDSLHATNASRLKYLQNMGIY